MVVINIHISIMIKSIPTIFIFSIDNNWSH